MDTTTVAQTSQRSAQRLDTAGSTHTGYVRGRNEDTFLHAPDRGLFVVADGLGGHPAGHVASQLAIDTLEQHLDAGLLQDDPGGALTNAIHAAHESILSHMRQDPETEGMGTTLVVASVQGTRLVLASVGDSRAYRLRDGSLVQLTADDVWEGSFGRTLTQALGTSGDITPEILDLELRPGDRVLLCTDGLTDMVDDELIADVLGAPMGAQQIVDRLSACALDHGGYDNITTVVVLAEDA